MLIADDDAAVRRHLQEGLTAAGLRCLEAADGQQVLSALRQAPPDLLLLDVEMPVLTGVDVCRIVKAEQGQRSFGFLPVILMTSRRTGKVEGLELGADDYLIKPFELAELSARVKSMLRLKALQDALLEKNRQLDLANRELEQRRADLLELSRTDWLTGLNNRRRFHELLDETWASSAARGLPLSCFMLDLDHFKRINDAHGHLAGDGVLQAVAACLREAVRQGDVLARYGGEEFIGLMPGLPFEAALPFLERLRSRVSLLRPPPGLEFTASIGLACAPLPSLRTGLELLQAADAALYAAKVAGRNCVAAPPTR